MWRGVLALESPGRRCVFPRRSTASIRGRNTPVRSQKSSMGRLLFPQRQCFHSCAADRKWNVTNNPVMISGGWKNRSFSTITFSPRIVTRSSTTNLLPRTSFSSLIMTSDRAWLLRGSHENTDYEEESKRRKQRFRTAHLIRLFASKPPSDDDENRPTLGHDETPPSPSRAPEGEPPPPSPPPPAQKNKPMEKTDFASFLSGRRTVDQAAKAASNKRRRVRSIAAEQNTELHLQIVNMQNLEKEKSRQKTAYNVYRALMGNVVICSGTS